MNPQKEGRDFFASIAKTLIGASTVFALFFVFSVASVLAADNVITDITLLDTNTNGQIDRIQIN